MTKAEPLGSDFFMATPQRNTEYIRQYATKEVVDEATAGDDESSDLSSVGSFSDDDDDDDDDDENGEGGEQQAAGQMDDV